MGSRPARPFSERLREAAARNRVSTAAIALCWVLHAFAQYPADFLLRPDREIWFVQLGTWLLLFGEGLALGLAVSIAAEAARNRVLASDPPARFGALSVTISRFLDSRWAPAAAGILASLAAGWSWGSFSPPPIIHDEAAYLLQARLFAAGHWVGPPAPIPEFFEQMYVFVWPFTAAKYPPGFSLALVPGIWLRAPALVPLLLVGMTGALLYSLARSIGNSWIAAIAWLLWRSNPEGRFLPPVYMSEQLSTALWLASWWALLRWKRGGGARFLALIALFLGWGAVTRPLTMFAAAIPIEAILCREAVRTRRWSPVLVPGAIGAVCLLLLPIWSQKTTGDWKVSPLALHVAWYTPYDVGFGTPAPPVRALPPDLALVARTLGRSRLQHTVRRIPQLIFERLAYVRADAFPGWRIVLVPALLYALFSVPAEGLLAAVTAAIDFALHLPVNHPANVSKYYLEVYPTLTFLAAAGIWAVFVGTPLRRPPDLRRSAAGLALLLAFLVLSVPAIARLRSAEIAARAPKVKFRRSIDSLPARSLVFVRYAPSHLTYRSLIENEESLADERVWLAYDRGADNARLRRIAPERIPYLYDEGRELLLRLDRPLDGEERRLVGESGSPD